MKNSVSGKTILVTGSTDWLGKLVAQQLAEKTPLFICTDETWKKVKRFCRY